jgi:hypothetical protein
MVSSTRAESSPLTFDLKKDLLQKIDLCRTHLGAKSVSEVVRLAITHYDYTKFVVVPKPHRQISVRLPLKVKHDLLRISKQKKVSVGELLRVALEKLPVHPVNSGAQTKTKPVEHMKKKATTKKPAAKKAPAKKAAPAKKTAKKK